MASPRQAGRVSDARFLGIDFSGAAAPWRPTCSRPTVWIAVLEGFRLVDLRPVQKLEPGGAPFDNLVSLLRAGRFRAAGIDAPFSLPDPHFPSGGHAQLLAEVGALPPASDRPFPRGPDLIALARTYAVQTKAKPHRASERQWSGANPRSTLWWKPRGGAPFAAACMTLLHRAGRPIWPWRDAPGMLVEAFPAAQLRAWDLPHASYTGAEAKPVRAKIIAAIERRQHVDIDAAERKEMLRTPDALDAFIAAFAGRAAANRTLKLEKPPTWKTEGAIAVHA
jgi:Protein of unknown function (DUF429)